MPTTIFREVTFEAAHWLPHVPEGHKCASMHGHSYTVRIHVAGAVDPILGWLEDWGDIDHHFAPLHQELDHHPLNEVPGLENPTCEHLAAWIWERLKPRIRGLVKLTIFEGPRGGVEYDGPDGVEVSGARP